VAFIYMAVNVHEGWPNHTSVDVNLGEITGASNTSGEHGVNLPVAYLDIHQGQPITVRL
tara:strand:- start:3394 stop:3570 length:177 start_codon:yes stop_codon:yes gene_type:complete